VPPCVAYFSVFVSLCWSLGVFFSYKTPMNILFLGDVVATPGRAALAQHLPKLRTELALDCVVVNGENAANGHGITADVAQEIFNSGADVITLGDHTFDQRGVEDLLATHPRIIRPANFGQGTVGRGHTVFTTPEGQRVAVINLQGRVFMRGNALDCPFLASKALMETYVLGETCDALILDIHAEATAEKAALAHLWDGKASLVVGTHTHIPTADTRIQPKGTAFQTDAGMCGDYNSSLGMSFSSVLPGYYSAGRHKFSPAEGPATLCGVLVQTSGNGLATAVKRITAGHPAFAA
jgi:metallophosphoesterase (TIGR00282 family)